MNLEKTIKNIYENADSYVMPDLVATIITDDYYLGSNDLTNYIAGDDSYEQKVLKAHENNHIFLNLGLITFAPFVNECDIYSTEDFTVKLSEDEFKKYVELKDEYFGILLLKNSCEYIIGTCDVCGCKIDSSFRALNKTEDNLLKKINEIIASKIID